MGLIARITTDEFNLLWETLENRADRKDLDWNGYLLQSTECGLGGRVIKGWHRETWTAVKVLEKGEVWIDVPQETGTLCGLSSLKF